VDCRMQSIRLTDCDFSLVSLGGARLRKAGLSKLCFRETNFVDADLTEADLRGSDLTGARLHGTRFAGADLRGAKLDADGLVAHVDLDTAVAYAAARGLVVH
jgi:uncharacterized protein YjbI with pentapeptide repeats